MNKGIEVGDESDYEATDSLDNKNDESQRSEQKVKTEEIKVAKLKRLQDVKSQAEIEAQKVMIAYKDKDISKDQPHQIEVDTKRASLRIIGHADAGKSSVCGNMMHLNGSKDSQRWPTWAPK